MAEAKYLVGLDLYVVVRLDGVDVICPYWRKSRPQPGRGRRRKPGWHCGSCGKVLGERPALGQRCGCRAIVVYVPWREGPSCRKSIVPEK